MHYPWTLPGRTKETYENLSQNNRSPSRDLKPDHPNMKQERQPLDHEVRFMAFSSQEFHSLQNILHITFQIRMLSDISRLLNACV
jgi:hypothetical protein